MSQQDRIKAARLAIADPTTTVEVRDADPGMPDRVWRAAALGFISTVVAAASVSLPADAKATSAAGSIETQPALAPLIVVIDGKPIETLHPLARVRLCKVVAAQSALKAHGLDWRDLYAFVHAETGWAPRDGMGRNGRVSRGLAQLEDATAKSLGVNANDPRQSLEAVAELLKEASGWSRVKGHSIAAGALSVHYNLSTKARNAWTGGSIEGLPLETQRHIANVAKGKTLADQLERAWSVQQKKFARARAGRPSSQRNLIAVDGAAEMQRMKGFAGSSLKPSDASSDRQAAGQVRQLVDRAGVRSAVIGLDQLRIGVLELIERIKRGARTQPLTAPGLRGPAPTVPGEAQRPASSSHLSHAQSEVAPQFADAPADAGDQESLHRPDVPGSARWARNAAFEMRRLTSEALALAAEVQDDRVNAERPRMG